MRVTIDLPDDLYTSLQKQAENKEKSSVNKRIRSILEDFHEVEEPGDRYVILKGSDRRAVEYVLEGTVHNGEELAHRVKNMGVVRVGEVEIGFTETQMRQIQGQVEFWGKPAPEYIKGVVVDAFNLALGTF